MEVYHPAWKTWTILMVLPSYLASASICRRSQKGCKHAESIDLQINTDKAKVLRLNCIIANPMEIKGKSVEDVDTFTYLGVIVNKTGRAREYINHRLSLARDALALMSPL